ncbi:MAG: DUF2007 domain-containing protein [Bacteroidales bacterium]|jgi:hypothetical protein|nr:DUF2007 domain-containing protein [Bacteroidales bacterium]
MRKVGEYSSDFAAEIAKGALESAGIHAEVLNKDNPFPSGGMKIKWMAIELVVNDADYDEAVSILKASSKSE